MYSEEKITFFDLPGTDNTGRALEVAARAWEKGSLARVVVASTTGATGVKALERFPGGSLVVVGHHVGFKEPGKSEMEPAHLDALKAGGASVLFATHALSSVGRSLSGKLGGVTAPELMAWTLRVLGEGFKVCLEMAIMAADAGLVPVDTESLFIGGTGRGADTVVALKPTHANSWWDMGVPRILCMPASRRRRD